MRRIMVCNAHNRTKFRWGFEALYSMLLKSLAAPIPLCPLSLYIIACRSVVGNEKAFHTTSDFPCGKCRIGGNLICPLDGMLRISLIYNETNRVPKEIHSRLELLALSMDFSFTHFQDGRNVSFARHHAQGFDPLRHSISCVSNTLQALMIGAPDVRSSK